MRHEKTKQIIDYWTWLFNKSGASRDSNDRMIWPERNDVHPGACSKLLGDMFVLDTDNGASSFRLAGTRLCSMYGGELKHHNLIELYADHEQSVLENWITMMNTEDYLLLLCSKGVTATGEAVTMETVLMPLSNRKRRGERLLGLTVALENPYWLGEKEIVETSLLSVRIVRPWEENGFKTNRPIDLTSLAPVRKQPQPKVKQKPSFAHLAKRAAQFDEPAKQIPEAYQHPKASHLRVLEGGRTD